jgi:HNH endonuclease
LIGSPIYNSKIYAERRDGLHPGEACHIVALNQGDLGDQISKQDLIIQTTSGTGIHFPINIKYDIINATCNGIVLRCQHHKLFDDKYISFYEQADGMYLKVWSRLVGYEDDLKLISGEKCKGSFLYRNCFHGHTFITLLDRTLQ